jgi:hypothetical protein|tara:strand:- start:98 stop:589 length:492 start_codon:yes stop_codon:yes gene_type:complete
VVVLVDPTEIHLDLDLLEDLVVLVVVAEHKTVRQVVKLNLVVMHLHLDKEMMVVVDGVIRTRKVVAAVVVPVLLDLLDLVAQREVLDYRFQRHLEIQRFFMIQVLSGISLVEVEELVVRLDQMVEQVEEVILPLLRVMLQRQMNVMVYQALVEVVLPLRMVIL